MAFLSHDTYLKNPYVFNSNNSYPNVQNYHQKNQYVQHKLNNNFLINQNPTKHNYQSLNLNKSILELPNQSKVSYARNYKLLISQVDPNQQAKKQKQRQNYRKQLQYQIKADKQRKIKQKQKIQQYEAQRERKFYAQIQIKTKQPKNKNQPSYFILRSGQKSRTKKNKTDRDLDQSRFSEEKQKSIKVVKQPLIVPTIIKRGGYHNQSTMDHNPYIKINQQTSLSPQKSRIHNHQSLLSSPLKSRHQSELQQRELQIIQQRNYQQQRINSIIKMQQKMLRKLDKFREQITKINKNIDLQKEVHQIRNILKSKSVKLENWSIRNDSIFQNYNDFYKFPKLQTKNVTRGSNRPHRSRVQQSLNLNQKYDQRPRMFTEQNPQSYQENETTSKSLQYVRRKRQIKLLNKLNDKNYEQNTLQNEENHQMQIPVIILE